VCVCLRAQKRVSDHSAHGARASTHKRDIARVKQNIKSLCVLASLRVSRSCCVFVFVFVFVYVYVCVRKREGERETRARAQYETNNEHTRRTWDCARKKQDKRAQQLLTADVSKRPQRCI